MYDHFRPRDAKAREAREAAGGGAAPGGPAASNLAAARAGGGGTANAGVEVTAGAGARTSADWEGWVARRYQAGTKEQVERQLFASVPADATADVS